MHYRYSSPLGWLAVTAILAFFTLGANASVISSQGFETAETGPNAYGWSDSSAISRTASGGGTLGLSAAGGGHYAEITNTHDTYSNGYGGAGYTYFGGRTTYPGSAFSQSVDVYLDPSWAQVPSGPAGKFSIDFAASKPNLSGSAYGTESRFELRLGTDPDTLHISARGDSSYAVIDDAGWYTFEVVFGKGATGTDPSTSTMNVYDAGSGDQIASRVFDNYDLNHPNDDAYTVLSQDLGGTGFVQFFVWRNGFAGDTLGIDNLETRALVAAVPAPATFALFGMGLLLLIGGLAAKRNAQPTAR